MRSVIGVPLACLVLGALPPIARAQAKLPAVEQIEVQVAEHGNGEVAVYDASGRIQKRFVGLGQPAALLPAKGENFYVADRRSGRVLEITPGGQIAWTFKHPNCVASVFGMTALPSGNLLLACGQAGLLEVNRDREVVWAAASPLQNVDVTGAVRLPDGSTILTLRDRQRPLYRIPAGSAEAVEITTPLPEERRNFPRCNEFIPEPGEFLLWDNDWNNVYRCALRDGKLVVSESFPLAAAWSLTSDRTGTLLYTREGLEICRWSADSERRCWRTVFWPTAVIPAADLDHILVSYERIVDASWPENWPAPPSGHAIDWTRFWLWAGAAVLLAALLQIIPRRPPRETKSSQRSEGRCGATDEPGAHPSGPISRHELAADHASMPSRNRRLGLLFATLVSAFVGVTLAWRGHSLLVSGFLSSWLPLYVSGAALAAASLELWRRRGLGQQDPFWAGTVQGAPDSSAWLRLTLGTLVLVAGVCLLFTWRSGARNYTDQVGLWTALFIVQVGLCFGVRTPCRRAPARWASTDVLFAAFALSVGAITIGYRLRAIPTNIHFDFVFYATEAYKLLNGYYRNIWTNGFVPAPAIGMVPEFLGLSLFGMGELGIRAGSALYGLSGVLAVYILGRTYRDRQTGLLAALFLAGSVPYIHFSRVPSNGEPATTALWVITFVAGAVRYGNPAWWILSGLAAGYTFFLHPVGRPSVVACAAFGLVVTIRSWPVVRRRWFGPILLLTAFAVVIIPLVPEWIRSPTLLLPRVEESVTVFQPSRGINWDALRASLGEPLGRSFGWFFVEADHSSQGTLSPGCNDIEAVLLAIGIALALLEGFSLNVLFLGYLLLVLLTCGAWAVTPPWYTRLLPTAPIAAVLMARTLAGFFAFLPFTKQGARKVTFALLVLAVTIASPGLNFRRYLRYESGQSGVYPLREMTAIGLRMRDLGSEYHYYLVITNNPSWTVHHRGGGRFGELLPYMWDKSVREVRQLETKLPLPANERAAFFLQAGRITEDLATLQTWYPDAAVEEVRGYRGELLAALVRIEPRSPPVETAPSDRRTVQPQLSLVTH